MESTNDYVPKDPFDAKVLALINIISFIVVFSIIFSLLVFSEVERITSSTISMLSSFFVVYMIMRGNGIKLNFKFKGPGFEAEIKDNLKNVQKDLSVTKKELGNQITSLNNSITSVNENVSSIKNVFNPNFDLGGLTEPFNRMISVMENMIMASHGFDKPNVDSSIHVPQKLQDNLKMLEIMRKEINELKSNVKKNNTKQKKLLTLEELSQLLNQANARYYEGDYEAALVIYNDLLVQKPEDYNISLNICKSLENLGRYDESESRVDELLRVRPSVDANLLKGSILTKRKKYDESVAIYEKLLSKDPKSERILSYISHTYLLQNKTAEVKPYLDRALSGTVKSGITFYNKACYDSLLGDHTHALDFLAKSIELNTAYKSMASSDKDFEPLWNDEKFKTLTSD